MTSTTARTSPPLAPTASSGRRRIVLIAAACVFAIALTAALLFAFARNDVPRLNDNAVVLTKFIGSAPFERLPFEQQRQYYKVLDDRDAELDQAYVSKRLTESEYRAGLEAAWLGKHINRVEKYFALPPGQGRTAYIAKLVDKKERKKAKAKHGAEEIDADETAAELRVEKWPAAARSQWTAFHEAYRAQKKATEKANKPQTKPAATASK